MNWDHLKHFRKEEFGEHADLIDDELLVTLDHARDIAGIPFHISENGGYRVEESQSEHGLGHGVDIWVRTSTERYLVTKGLLLAGCKRIGVYDQHVHAGNDPFRPQLVLWVGESR